MTERKWAVLRAVRHAGRNCTAPSRWAIDASLGDVCATAVPAVLGLDRRHCGGDGGVPLILAEVAGAVWFYSGSGAPEGKVAAGEPPAAVVIEDVPQAAGSGLVNYSGLVAASGGSGPRAVAVGQPGGSDSGPVIGAAAHSKAGGCDGQHGVQFPAPGGVDDGVRAGGDLLAVLVQRVVGDRPVQGQVGTMAGGHERGAFEFDAAQGTTVCGFAGGDEDGAAGEGEDEPPVWP
jgi:hypothetical protein